jgi:Domain of unknown function (DUF1707)
VHDQPADGEAEVAGPDAGMTSGPTADQTQGRTSDPTPVPPPVPTPVPTVEDKDRYLRLLDNAMARGLLDGEEYMERAAAIDSAASIDELNRIVQEMPLLPMGGTGRPASSSTGSAAVGAGSTAATSMSSSISAHDVHNVNDLNVNTKTNVESSQVGGVAEGANVEVGDPEMTAAAWDPLATPLPEIDEEAKLDAVDLALLHRQSRAARPSAATTGKRWTALIVVAVMFILLIVVGILLASHSKSVNDQGLATVGRHAQVQAQVQLVDAAQGLSSSSWSSAAPFPFPFPFPLPVSPLPAAP